MPIVLITGGTGKLGKQFIHAFLEKGWTVLFTSTSEKRINELYDSEGRHQNLQGFVSDLSTAEGVDALVKAVVAERGTINCLVNNARSLSSLSVGQNGLTKRADFESEFLLDVIVPYELSMGFAVEEGSGLRTVINIGSQYGLVAANPRLYEGDIQKFPIQYGVAKAAVNHLTKELAVRLAQRNVRVNCVAYGGVEGRVDDEFLTRYSELTPSGKMLSEADVAGPVVFLAGDGASSITGHTLVADGGWSIW